MLSAAKNARRLLRIHPKPKKGTTVKGHHPVKAEHPQTDAGPGTAHIPVPVTPQLICQPRSWFAGANNFSVGKLSITDSTKTIQGNEYVDASQHTTVNVYNGGESKGWETLLQNTAPSALLDAQSYDGPRCDDDTRLDVRADIHSWIQDPTPPQKILCITGPVGCGKSALQRTTAEECSAQGTLAAAFFFSSSDPARDDTARFVPTIAYQLAALDPGIRSTIVQCIDTDPLVFRKSLRSQMDLLVISPLRQAHLTARLSGTGSRPLPNVIIIDGLDECKGESMQVELLKTLEHLVRALSSVGLHLRIIVTSRPEWTIWSAVEKNAIVRHMKLADEYDATDDIRLYVQKQLDEIASMSRDPRLRGKGGWPIEEDVEALVQNASGQFIYVVVALNYISERHSSPVDRLKAILSWSPSETSSGKHQAHPLSALDALYAGILHNAQEAYEEIEHTSNIVMLIRLHQFNKEARFARPDEDIIMALDIGGFEAFLGMQDGETYALISDMRSLLTIREADQTPAFPLPRERGAPMIEASGGYDHIHFYHMSLLNFLDDPGRAEGMYISSAEVASHFVVCALQQISAAFQTDIESLLEIVSEPNNAAQSSRLQVLEYSLYVLASALPEVVQLTRALIDTLYRFTEAGGWERLDKYTASSSKRASQFCDAFARVLELYAAGCVEEVIHEEFTEAQLCKLMDIVGDHRLVWNRKSR